MSEFLELIKLTNKLKHFSLALCHPKVQIYVCLLFNYIVLQMKQWPIHNGTQDITSYKVLLCLTSKKCAAEKPQMKMNSFCKKRV